MSEWMVTHCLITYPNGRVEHRYSALDNLSYPLFLAQTAGMPQMFSDARIIKKGLTQEEAFTLKEQLKGENK